MNENTEQAAEQEICVFTPSAWNELADEELKDRIARWRAGENFGEPTDTTLKGLAAIYQRDKGMRSDLSIEDRQQAQVHSIRLVGEDPRVQAKDRPDAD